MKRLIRWFLKGTQWVVKVTVGTLAVTMVVGLFLGVVALVMAALPFVLLITLFDWLNTRLSQMLRDTLTRQDNVIYAFT